MSMLPADLSGFDAEVLLELEHVLFDLKPLLIDDVLVEVQVLEAHFHQPERKVKIIKKKETIFKSVT